MKKIPLHMSLLVAILLLTGCGVTTVTEYRTTYVAPSDTMITGCRVSPPPDIDLYLRSTPKDKEKILSQAWLSQTSNLIECNGRMNDLREWKSKLPK